MELIACTNGEWQHAQDGAAICTGTLQNVAAGGPLGLPPLTYDEADAILMAVIGLFVVVFIVRQIARVIR